MPPIDPNIIAGLRTSPPINAPDPIDRYSKSLALKNLMAQSDMQGLQMQQAQQGVDDESAVRSAYQQAGGDSSRLRALLQGGGQYKQLRELDKTDLESQAKQAAIGKDKSAAGKTDFETQIGKVQHVSSVMSTAKDQPSWDMARRVLTISFPELSAKLPEQFDPGFVRAKIAEGQTITQKLSAEATAQQQGITTRGQDMTAATAAAGQAVTTRGQDLTNTRALEANAAAKGTQQVNVEGKIRDDYTSASKQFVTVRDAHQRVIESAKDPSAAGDLALIFNYMKVLDPGSTVREGEFATAQNAAGLPDRMRAQYNKVVNGEKLADAQRSDFLDRSGRLYKAAETNQIKVENDFKGISERSGARPENVVISNRVKESGPDDRVPQVTKTIGKTKYVQINGQWFEDRP